MKKYFSVETKCGHVGKLNCVWIKFAICAENAKEAAAIARQKARAKHHHKNTIKEVIEIRLKPPSAVSFNVISIYLSG